MKPIQRLLRRVSVIVLSTLCLLFCGCANRGAQANRDYNVQVERQNHSYYAALARGCDVFLKLKPLEPDTLYVCESTNLKMAHLPSIITDLKPDRIIYTSEGVSIERGKNAWIGWDRDKTRTNIWKMTIHRHGEEKIVYEEPSTKCQLTFGYFDDADNLTAANRVSHRVGSVYGWKLRIYSREDKVRIKEIFELPSGAPWNADESGPDGVTLVSNQLSPNGNRRLQEYDLTIEKGYGETEFIQQYRVIKGDPIGNHKMSIFLDGQLIRRFTFQVVGE